MDLGCSFDSAHWTPSHGTVKLKLPTSKTCWSIGCASAATNGVLTPRSAPTMEPKICTSVAIQITCNFIAFVSGAMVKRLGWVLLPAILGKCWWCWDIPWSLLYWVGNYSNKSWIQAFLSVLVEKNRGFSPSLQNKTHVLTDLLLTLHIR